MTLKRKRITHLNFLKAPSESEEEEVEVKVVEKEAAPLAPQEHSTPLPTSPKAPATRDSVSRFLSPTASS